MTNQASEELREIFINRMWNYFGIEDKSELAHFGTIYDQAVAPIIRTEKLKTKMDLLKTIRRSYPKKQTLWGNAQSKLTLADIDRLIGKTKLEAEL